MPSYVRREAVSSSRIENTQAGMEDLFAYEIDKSNQRTSDVKEVANYVKALLYGINRLKDLPICNRLIRELHAILMEGVRGGQAFPGEYRTTQNWIGSPGCSLADATYVPPPVAEMNDALSALEKYINEDTKEPALVKCAFLHYQFEAIHPFVDGNGRIGRLRRGASIRRPRGSGKARCRSLRIGHRAQATASGRGADSVDVCPCAS